MYREHGVLTPIYGDHRDNFSSANWGSKTATHIEVVEDHIPDSKWPTVIERCVKKISGGEDSDVEVEEQEPMMAQYSEMLSDEEGSDDEAVEEDADENAGAAEASFA